MTAAAVQLHLPDEPAQRAQWRDAVLSGAALASVVTGPGGVGPWLWDRWRVLRGAGIDQQAFDRALVSYQRELWLWMNGDRTWDQCCGGLIGRIGRRIPT